MAFHREYEPRSHVRLVDVHVISVYRMHTWPGEPPLREQRRVHSRLAWECFDKAVAAHPDRLVTLVRRSWAAPSTVAMAIHDPAGYWTGVEGAVKPWEARPRPSHLTGRWNARVDL